jgi:hypothetical protein
MFSRFQAAVFTLTLTTGLVAAGCGAGTSLSPTGPSLGAGTGAQTSDLVVSTGMSEAAAPAAKGGGRGPKVDDGSGEDNERGHRPDTRVEVNGRITAIDAATHTLTVGTRQVSVPATAVIRHGSRTFAFADLAVGDHVEVKGTVTDAAVVASEVKVEQKRGVGDDDAEDGEDDDDDNDPTQVELTGAVSALAGTCPVATFTVTTAAAAGAAATTTQVATTATTTFGETTCAAVVNGVIVEVKGTRQADGSIVATRVSLED